MNTKIKTIFIVMFTFSFIFMLALEFTLPSERNDEVYFCEYFNDGWQQIHSDGTAEDVDIPANLISDNEDETIIETTLPDNVKDDTYIITRSVRADMVIYIDGEVRASYSTSESRLWGKTNPANFVYASLGPMDSGKVVTIYTSTEDYYAGIFYDIYYANYAGFWAHMANENMPTFIFAFVVFVVAFLSLMVSLAFIIILGKDIKFTWLSMEVLLVSTWMITNSVFRQIIFPNVSIISDVSFFCVLFMVIPITEYMNLLQQNRYRKFYLGVEIYSLIAAIAAIILQLFKIYDFAETFNYYAIAIPVMVTMTFMTIIWDIKTGKIKEYLVIAVIFFCTAVVALIQLGAYVLRNVDFDISINAATMLLLLFAGIMDTIKEVISLQKDKQTAVVASEMKTEFLANMSHEIRTPINAILGMNEMILRESTEENIASYATDVDNSGRMLLMLINDVLDFSKIESGRMELVESEFDIVSALSDVYMLIRLKVKEKNLVFNVNIDPDIPKMVMGDENRYKQALTNILTNAVKYTEKGSVSLNVTGRALEDGKFLIEAIVKDTGIGIKKDDLDKLFDAFQRVDEKKNRSIEGTGLGLAITQQIVSLMGGDIRVESTYGKGSTFTISIVFKVSGTETVGETNFDKYEGKKEKAQLREFSSPGSKVLVVDDVAMNIRVFMQFIKNTGIDAESALSGKEAIDKWKKTKYDLVFLDHMMPELDGIETARIMWKENEVNKDTPIIMLTANAIAGMKEKYEAEGFSDYITKPFKYDEFIDALEKYLPNKNTGPDIAKIDIEAGMVYCANDKDFYKEVLNEYLESDKTADLKARYEEKDAENLRILVHSLKSTSKTVGATEFSQLALELENAVKAEDWQTIDALFDNTISGYAAVRDEVRKVFEEI